MNYTALGLSFVRIRPNGLWHFTRVRDPRAPLLCEMDPAAVYREFHIGDRDPKGQRCVGCVLKARARAVKLGAA